MMSKAFISESRKTIAENGTGVSRSERDSQRVAKGKRK